MAVGDRRGHHSLNSVSSPDGYGTQMARPSSSMMADHRRCWETSNATGVSPPGYDHTLAIDQAAAMDREYAEWRRAVDESLATYQEAQRRQRKISEATAATAASLMVDAPRKGPIIDRGDAKRLQSSRQAQVSVHTTEPSASRECTLCHDAWHKLVDCAMFHELPVTERRAHVRKENLCVQCLAAHRGVCFLKAECNIGGCKMKHH
uniref:Uncharacterized protein n=1 Tax=Anopheles culicifacies TaxID=139723 RepID=A0A182M2M0_9DIPT